MELLNWSFNAIDKIFSTRREGTGEPSCPDGTFLAGYTMDGWDKWRVVCLAVLDIEDVEDVYLFGFMMVGLIGLGFGQYLMHRQLRKKGFDVSGNRELLTILRNLRSDITKIKGKIAIMQAENTKPPEDSAENSEG